VGCTSVGPPASAVATPQPCQTPRVERWHRRLELDVRVRRHRLRPRRHARRRRHHRATVPGVTSADSARVRSREPMDVGDLPWLRLLAEAAPRVEGDALAPACRRRPRRRRRSTQRSRRCSLRATGSANPSPDPKVRRSLVGAMGVVMNRSVGLARPKRPTSVGDAAPRRRPPTTPAPPASTHGPCPCRRRC
jgi:hypothetical protein